MEEQLTFEEESDIPRTTYLKGATYIEELSDSERQAFKNSAFLEWRVRNGYDRLEWPLIEFDVPMLSATSRVIKTSGGWLRYVRRLKKLSTNAAAKVHGITKSAYADLEASEQRGTISVGKLKQLCESMGAELIVGVRSIELPSRALWNSLEEEAVARFERKATKRLSAKRSLIGDANFLAGWSKAKRKRGWTERQLDLNLCSRSEAMSSTQPDAGV